MQKTSTFEKTFWANLQSLSEKNCANKAVLADIEGLKKAAMSFYSQLEQIDITDRELFWQEQERIKQCAIAAERQAFDCLKIFDFYTTRCSDDEQQQKISVLEEHYFTSLHSIPDVEILNDILCSAQNIIAIPIPPEEKEALANIHKSFYTEEEKASLLPTEVWDALKSRYKEAKSIIISIQCNYNYFIQESQKWDLDRLQEIEGLSQADKQEMAAFMLAKLQLAAQSKTCKINIKQDCLERLGELGIRESDLALFARNLKTQEEELTHKQLIKYFNFICEYGDEITQSAANKLPWFNSERWTYKTSISGIYPSPIYPAKLQKFKVKSFKNKKRLFWDYHRQINTLRQLIIPFVQINQKEILNKEFYAKVANRTITQTPSFFNVFIQDIKTSQSVYDEMEQTLETLYVKISSLKTSSNRFLFRGTHHLAQDFLIFVDMIYLNLINHHIELIEHIKDRFIEWTRRTFDDPAVTSEIRQCVQAKIEERATNLQNKVDHLEYLRKSHQKEKNRISQWFARHFNRLKCNFLRRRQVEPAILSDEIPVFERKRTRLNEISEEVVAHLQSELFTPPDPQERANQFFKGHSVTSSQLLLIKNVAGTVCLADRPRFWIESSHKHEVLLTTINERLQAQTLDSYILAWLAQAVEYLLAVKNEPLLDRFRTLLRDALSKTIPDSQAGSGLCYLIKKVGSSNKATKQWLLVSMHQWQEQHDTAMQELNELLAQEKGVLKNKVAELVKNMVKKDVSVINLCGEDERLDWELIVAALSENKSKLLAVRQVIETIVSTGIALKNAAQQYNSFEQAEALYGSQHAAIKIAYSAADLLREQGMFSAQQKQEVGAPEFLRDFTAIKV